jgi:hypothetical protein
MSYDFAYHLKLADVAKLFAGSVKGLTHRGRCLRRKRALFCEGIGMPLPSCVCHRWTQARGDIKLNSYCLSISNKRVPLKTPYCTFEVSEPFALADYGLSVY